MEFDITANQLAEALDITEEELYRICDFFDEKSDDDWELTENVHFRLGAYRSRIFSSEGAVEICNYLQKQEEKDKVLTNRGKISRFARKFKRWVFNRDRQLKGLMITKRVQETTKKSGHLIFLNSRAFLHPRSCREILGLGTRQDILHRTFSELVKNENIEIEPPRKDVDFYDHNTEGRYFSSTGLASLGKQLSKRLTKKHRRIWADVVAEYAPKAISYLEKEEKDRSKNIKKVMDQVRKEANGYCQVSGKRQSIGKFDLEVHHLYDRKHYPNLADKKDNLIAISSDLHTDFHKWNGGTDKPCSIDDFMKYVLDNTKATHIFGDVSNDTNYQQFLKVKNLLENAKKSLSGHL